MKKVLLIVSTNKTDAKELADKISEYLHDRKFETVIFYYDGYNNLNLKDKLTKDKFKFVISLGGDGNVLFASRFAAPRNIPVMPINFGRFGFIASIEPADWKTSLDNFLAKKLSPHIRMLLNVKVMRNGKCIKEADVLNEIVVSGSGVSKLINVELFYKEFPFGIFRSDGVIVSTPTGSTAHAVASGGPILDPTMQVFVLVPIAPFTLSNRPIVLPAYAPLTIKILPQRQERFALFLSIDGQESTELKTEDEVVVVQSKHTVNLIGGSQRHFYKVLQAKLGWSGSFKFKDAQND